MPIFWAQYGAHISPGLFSFFPAIRPVCQAVACWGWLNFLASLCPAGKRVVHVNMDETTVRMWLEPDTGYVVVRAGKRKVHVLEREQQAGLGKRRQCTSLMAFSSDDAEVQKLLPQVLLLNERTLSAAATIDLQASLAGTPRFLVRRGKSAWANAPVLCWLIRLLRKCLATVEPVAHVILTLDCSPAHACTQVVKCIGQAGFYAHYVPASMTAVLQPLDVYTFAVLKRRLRDLHHEAVLETDSGVINALPWLKLVFGAVADVLHTTCWTRSFRGCGFGDGQQSLGARVRRRLEYETPPPPVPAELPSLAQLQTIWIARREIPITWLFYPCLRLPGPPQEPELADETPSVIYPNPWIGRLRSSRGSMQPPPSPAPPALVPLPACLAACPRAAAPPQAPSLSPPLPPPLPPAGRPPTRLPVGRPLLRRRTLPE